MNLQSSKVYTYLIIFIIITVLFFAPNVLGTIIRLIPFLFALVFDFLAIVGISQYVSRFLTSLLSPVRKMAEIRSGMNTFIAQADAVSNSPIGNKPAAFWRLSLERYSKHGHSRVLIDHIEFSSENDVVKLRDGDALCHVAIADTDFTPIEKTYVNLKSNHWHALELLLSRDDITKMKAEKGWKYIEEYMPAGKKLLVHGDCKPINPRFAEANTPDAIPSVHQEVPSFYVLPSRFIWSLKPVRIFLGSNKGQLKADSISILYLFFILLICLCFTIYTFSYVSPQTVAEILIQADITLPQRLEAYR